MTDTNYQDLKHYPMKSKNNRRHHTILIVFACFLVTQNSEILAQDPITSLYYNKTPIEIQLTIGQEQQLRFDESIELGLELSLTRQLKVDNVQGTLYLKPVSEFSQKRLAIKTQTSRQVILIDLSSTFEATPTQPISIQLADSKTRLNPESNSLSPIQLLRFAAKHVYAPTRLVPNHPQVRRVHTRFVTSQWLEHPVLNSQLLAAWQSGPLSVVAVEVSNISTEVQELQQADIRGQWLLMALFGQRLLPQGKLGSTTVIFLVGHTDSLSWSRT